MAHYLDPINYLTFKLVFGEHKHLCISLLNSLLPLEKPIVEIEYQTVGALCATPLLLSLRGSIVNVRCTDTANRQFIVEIRLYWSESFKNRVLFNASKAYVMQMDNAEDFELMQPVYALNFVDSTFEKSPEMEDEYYHYYKIVSIKDTEKQIKGLELLFIELPKFKPTNRAEKELHELWLRFLTEIDGTTKEVPQELINNELTREAVKLMERTAYTKGQLDEYYNRKIDAMTERSVFTDARREGRMEGRIESENGKIAIIAKHLLKKGMSIEDVCDATGLSEQQIEAVCQSS